MTTEQTSALFDLDAVEAELRRRNMNKLSRYYPEEGPLRRELYRKHLEFFAAGAERRERLFMAANRVGKTEGVGAYELVLHLTGRYPRWWTGRRFDGPVRCWACGDTGQTTRDILQQKLLGDPDEMGTGMVPGELLEGVTRKPVTQAVDFAYVKHVSGGRSWVQFKSYEQGRKVFFGQGIHVVWLDEEPPKDVYDECLLRTMTTDGVLMCTFTPLLGVTEVVRSYMHQENGGNKFFVSATWDDAPHLSRQAREELYREIPAYQRDARTKGIPQLGSGAIYPVAESDVVVPGFEIPAHWPRGYGMDVGWNRTAAVHGALDRESDVLYLYSEHYVGSEVPSTHAAAIAAKGRWVPGFIDPASRGRSQVDGTQLLKSYENLGLALTPADNAVETGIHEVWQRMSSGRLKVFHFLTHWLEEFRIYQRDKNGRVVKQFDHLMDCTRYLVVSGVMKNALRTVPAVKKAAPRLEYVTNDVAGAAWMGG